MKYHYLFLTVSFAIVILYFSLIPIPQEVQPISHFDKALHFCSYFLLALLCYKTSDNLKLSIVLAGSYGLLIEIIQLGIPFRSFEILDIIVNYAGAGLLLIVRMKR